MGLDQTITVVSLKKGGGKVPSKFDEEGELDLRPYREERWLGEFKNWHELHYAVRAAVPNYRWGPVMLSPGQVRRIIKYIAKEGETRYNLRWLLKLMRGRRPRAVYSER